MWKCKECGSEFFILRKIEVEESFVKFNERGIKEETTKTNSVFKEQLECADCGNKASVYKMIEEIAYWEEK